MTLREFIKKHNLETWDYMSGGKVNKVSLPRHVESCCEEGMAATNELLELLERDYPDRKLGRTRSEGIKQMVRFGWDVDQSPTGIEVVFLDELEDDVVLGFRWSFGAAGSISKESGITGRGSYFKMLKEFEKDGIELLSYAVENGAEVKKQIKKPMIDARPIDLDVVWDHAYHLDLHSAYPSGMCAAYPELKPTCERIYNNRKKSEKDKELKLQMDAAIGFFQSKYCSVNGYGFALANLAKAGVNWCRKTILGIADELRAKGKYVLAFNTDGIWDVDEQGDFSSDWIGEGLGKAGIDHKDCTIRFKSKGAYEYMEDGRYEPVVRGRTKLDAIKSRDEWEWGDIYKAPVILFAWDPETRRIVETDGIDDELLGGR